MPSAPVKAATEEAVGAAYQRHLRSMLEAMGLDELSFRDNLDADTCRQIEEAARDMHDLERSEIDTNSPKAQEHHSDLIPIDDQLIASNLSEGLHQRSTIPTANTTDKAETAGVDAKLSLFFADSRVTRFCK